MQDQASRSVRQKYESSGMTRGHLQLYACQACLLTGGSVLIMGTIMGCILTELKAETIIKFENAEFSLYDFVQICVTLGKSIEFFNKCRNAGHP